MDWRQSSEGAVRSISSVHQFVVLLILLLRMNAGGENCFPLEIDIWVREREREMGGGGQRGLRVAAAERHVRCAYGLAFSVPIFFNSIWNERYPAVGTQEDRLRGWIAIRAVPTSAHHIDRDDTCRCGVHAQQQLSPTNRYHRQSFGKTCRPIHPSIRSYMEISYTQTRINAWCCLNMHTKYLIDF